MAAVAASAAVASLLKHDFGANPTFQGLRELASLQQAVIRQAGGVQDEQALTLMLMGCGGCAESKAMPQQPDSAACCALRCGLPWNQAQQQALHHEI